MMDYIALQDIIFFLAQHSPCDTFWCADFCEFCSLKLPEIFHVMRVGVMNLLRPPVAAVKYQTLIALSFVFLWWWLRWIVEIWTHRKCEPWPTFIWKTGMCLGTWKRRCCEFVKLLGFGRSLCPCFLWQWPWFNARPETLGVARSQPPKTLSSLISSLQYNDVTQMLHRVEQACSELQAWLWDEKLLEDAHDKLFYTIRDVKLGLEDLKVLLSHAQSSPSPPGDWPDNWSQFDVMASNRFVFFWAVNGACWLNLVDMQIIVSDVVRIIYAFMCVQINFWALFYGAFGAKALSQLEANWFPTDSQSTPLPIWFDKVLDAFNWLALWCR